MGGGGEVGVPQNIMHALCAVIRPNQFKFASYGPVKTNVASFPALPQTCKILTVYNYVTQAVKTG